MMALVGIERRLGRLPARVPDDIAVLDVVVASVLIERRIVITVTGQTQKFCVLVEAVSAAGIGNQRKEVLRSQIVDPRKRSLRACDDILFFASSKCPNCMCDTSFVVQCNFIIQPKKEKTSKNLLKI